MHRLPVESTLLASIAYDPDRTLLELEFCDGRRYRFFKVPTRCFRQLLESPSKGTYFNRNIRNCFFFQRVADNDLKN